MKSWNKMQAKFESQEEMTGYITGKIKGGFVVSLKGFHVLCHHHKSM